MKKNKQIKSIMLIAFSCIITSLSNFAISQTAPSNLVFSQSSGIAYRGVGQNSVAPSINDGGATVSYSLVNPPAGVSINGNTGQISWASTLGVGTYVLNILATNIVGSTNGTYNLNVVLNPDDYLIPKYTSASTSNLTYTGALSTANSANLVDVYYPAGDTNTQRPVFMFMHGGGFSTSNDKTQSYVVAFCKYMATCGYIAFAPNYNVGGGHTLTQNLKSCKDMDACLNSIRNNTINFPTSGNYKHSNDYLFVGGGSAGGHLSCNFVFADGGSNYGGFTPNLNNVIAEIDGWGSSPTSDRLYNFANLNSNSMPTFLVQGTSDQTVPVQNSIDLDIALTAAGSYHNFWKIAGETHGCPNHIAAISDSIAHFNNRAWKRKYVQTVNTIVLPIKLSFFGVQQKDEKILINWETTNEENSHHFEIERSTNGTIFSKIGVIAAKVNSAIKQSYQYFDETILSGSIYYRLKEVDKNGTISYSNIVAINVKATKNIITNFYPNPVTLGEALKINFIAKQTCNVHFEFLNILGQTAATQFANVNEGNNTITLNTNNLKIGIYYLTVSINNTIQQRLPFVVK